MAQLKRKAMLNLTDIYTKELYRMTNLDDFTKYLYENYLRETEYDESLIKKEIELLKETLPAISAYPIHENSEVNNYGEGFINLNDLPENIAATFLCYELSKGLLKYIMIPIAEHLIKKKTKDILSKYKGKVDEKLISIIQTKIIEWVTDYVKKI